MITTKCIKFKGEIENYLRNDQNNIESKIDGTFSSLKFKTCLCKANIIKKDGYHASHLLFILTILPLLKVKSVHSFCKKHWQHWSKTRKDTLYRFKQNTAYRWRSFMYKINSQIFKAIELDNIPQEERYFVIDDTILAKLGKKIENVSYIYDHKKIYQTLAYRSLLQGMQTATRTR